jgi:hypothetical protein
MREIEVDGIQGVGDVEQSAGTDSDLKQLQAELKAAQARVAELEDELLLLHQSRTYRAASRIWRIRKRTRAMFHRRPPRAPRELIEARAAGVEPQVSAEELEARAPADELEARTTAEELRAQATAEELEALAPDRARSSNGDPDEIDRAQDAQPVLYYGSRGVRETDREQSGSLRAVLLMGGMTESQLESALRGLDDRDATDVEPLVVTDCDALKTLDSAGHLYEYIPPREDWELHLGRNGDDYDDFVRRRLASIAGMYGLPGIPSIS